MTRKSLLAALLLVNGWAFAQIPGVDSPSGTPAAKPGPRAQGAGNEAFRKLRAQCEAESCSPRGGEACAEAAAMVMSETPPDEFFDVSGTLRTKLAIRLLEKGTVSSNLARSRAYDIYSAFGIGAIVGHADSYRANELLRMMRADNYVGLQLREARTKTGVFHMGASDEEKARSCNLARTLSARGGLDADSARLAREILSTETCTTGVKN